MFGWIDGCSIPAGVRVGAFIDSVRRYDVRYILWVLRGRDYADDCEEKISER